MKKILLILITFATLSTVASAQKFGHVNSKEIIDIMPETVAAQKTLETEGKKLETQLQAIMGEYQTKLQAYQENIQLADAAPEKWSTAVRSDKEQELQQLGERIQRFQENAQQSIQQKQSELLKPVMDKYDAAVKKVAEAGGYVYVMDKNSVLFINENLSTDLTNAIKKELGL